MRQNLLIKTVVIIAMMFVSTVGYTQAKRVSPTEADADKKETPKNTAKAAGEVTAASPEGAAPVASPVPENTPELCQDKVDNDVDSHTDCDDQDCEIYAVCVDPEEVEEVPPPPRLLVTPPPRPEQAWQCRDGVDNDKNGLIDCRR